MNLIALLKSLVGHLGYFRTNSDTSRFKFLIDGPDGLAAGCRPSEKAASDSRNIEKYRAFAGCFVIASMYIFQSHSDSQSIIAYVSNSTSSSCKRADSLPYTKSLEAACKALADRAESPDDRQIPYIVSIHRVFLKLNNFYNESDHELGHSSAPVRMHANALKLELHAIKESIPSDLIQYGMSLLFITSGFLADSLSYKRYRV